MTHHRTVGSDAAREHDPGPPGRLRRRPVTSIAGRALRSVPASPSVVLPALFIPVFFYVVNVGALQDFTERRHPGFDYKAFQLPVAIIFAVTGISRAGVARDRHPGRLLRPAAAHARSGGSRCCSG